MGLLDDFRGKEEINQLKNQLTEKDAEVANLQTKLDEQRTANAQEAARLCNSAEESATANSALSRELEQATLAVDRLTSAFEGLVRSTAEDKSQAAITIADLNKKLAAVAPEVAAIKAERDRAVQEIQRLREIYDDKDRGYQEREAKLAKKSEELLHERQKFQQQAMDLQTRKQHWKQVVEPQLARYEAHCSLDLREQQSNALRVQLDEHERSLKDREADLIRRQCTDETLATREAEIAVWDKLLTDKSDKLEVKTAAQDQRESELDERERELAAFRERAKHLDEEATQNLLEARRLESKEARQLAHHAERLAELRQQRTELRQQTKDLEQQREEVDEKSRKLRLANAALQSRVDKLNSDIAVLRIEVSKRDRLIADLKRTIASFTGGIPDRKLGFAVFKEDAVLRWMFKETGPSQVAVESGYLCMTGTGPWPDNNVKRQLEERGFTCSEMPDAEVGHIIVGRDDWDDDLLLKQIDCRQGKSLRAYSQEMWFAMMATGRDPLDEDDSELLKAFGEGHPALEFLMKSEFPWPLLSLGKGDLFENYDLVSESPLHKLGYRVGTTSNLTPTDRRKILKLCFDAKKLEFSDDSSQSYVIGWGKSESAQRLYRMALHIKSLVDGMVGRDPNRKQSRLDWITDLKWLKSTYYSRFARRFTWPDISVR